MHHADLEAACQKWPGALAPGPVFGALGVEAGHVVAAILVDGELAAAGPEHPIDLRDLTGVNAPERRPETEDNVGGPVGRVDPEWRLCRHGGETGARSDEAIDDRAAGGVDDKHVAIRDRTEGIERGDELAGAIEGANERTFELTRQRHREIGHRGSIGAGLISPGR